MPGRTELSASQPEGSGGGGSGSSALDVEAQEAADNLEASQALQQALGIVTESNKTTRELIKAQDYENELEIFQQEELALEEETERIHEEQRYNI